MFNSLEEYLNNINEGFILKNNLIYFTPGENKDMVDTTIINNNISKKQKIPMKYYYCYKIVNKDENDIGLSSKKIQKALKKDPEAEYQMDEKSYNDFIKRTSILLVKKIKNENIDTLFYVESSATLNIDIINNIKSSLPYIKMFPIIKKKGDELSNLHLSKEWIESQLKKNKTDFIDSQQKMIDRIKRKGSLKIKTFMVSVRQNVIDWLKLDDFNFSKYIENKKIGVFDDFVTSESTSMESYRTLMNTGLVNSISFFSIFK